MKGLFRSGMRGRRGGYHTPVGAGLRWVRERPKDLTLRAPGKAWKARRRESKAKSRDLTQRTQRSARRERREKLRRGLLRAGGAVVRPSLHRGHKFRTVERRQRASIARIPAPAHEIVRGHVL